TATVSGQHLEIRWVDGAWRIVDSGSTNGTFLDGLRIVDTELRGDTTIRLGCEGPEFSFIVEDVAPSELDSTLVIPAGISLMPSPPSGTTEQHNDLLEEAVPRARRARTAGYSDQTMTVMREMLRRALRRNSRRFRGTIWALAVALALISAGGYWKIA